jgi:hypothetical protein
MRFWSKWRMPGIKRLGRLALFLVSVIGSSGFGLTSVQQSHCASHATPAMHAEAGHTSDSAATSAWTLPAHGDCSHCPPTECATVAPCSVAGVSAALTKPVVLRVPPAHTVGFVRVRSVLHSTPQQPPTPPPQPIA